MKIRIPSEIKSRLNKKYISEVPVTISVKNDYRNIFDNHPVFIKTIISRGSCLTLHDVDFRISETTFWDKETFEDYCKYVFWAFNEKYLQKLIHRIPEIKPGNLSFFIETLAENSEPYIDAIGHPTDPYLNFCGKKLKSLKRQGHLDKAYELDFINRQCLLKELKSTYNAPKSIPNPDPNKPSEELTSLPQPATAKTKKPIAEPKTIIKENTTSLTFSKKKKTQPFIDLLKSPDLKKTIQEKLTEADIPFLIFKKIQPVGNNRNPDGFNSAIAVMIVTFKELGYFKDDFSFDEILDAYLKETGNSIGKVSDFKRHYMKNKYYKTYKEDLYDLDIPKID